MQKPNWFDGKINAGNIISWLVILVSIAISYTATQADVKALQAFRDETKTEIKEVKRDRQADRENLQEMKGDIRVIRQILEGVGRKPL